MYMWWQKVYKKSLHLPLTFVVNLKLFYKNKVLRNVRVSLMLCMCICVFSTHTHIYIYLQNLTTSHGCYPGQGTTISPWITVMFSKCLPIPTLPPIVHFPLKSQCDSSSPLKHNPKFFLQPTRPFIIWPVNTSLTPFPTFPPHLFWSSCTGFCSFPRNIKYVPT